MSTQELSNLAPRAFTGTETEESNSSRDPYISACKHQLHVFHFCISMKS